MLTYHAQYLLIERSFCSDSAHFERDTQTGKSGEIFDPLPPNRLLVNSHSAFASSCLLPRPQSFPITYPRNTISGILRMSESENGIQFLPMQSVLKRSRGSRDSAVVRALASHQCGRGDSRTGVICGLSLLLVLVLAKRVFSGPCVCVPAQKPTLLNSSSIGNLTGTGLSVARLLRATLVKQCRFYLSR